MKLAIHGATGRMGLSVARLAHVAPDIEIVGALCSADDPALGRDLGEVAGLGEIGVQVSADISSSLLGAEVVIDFSVATAVVDLFKYAERQGVAVVSGTTNFDEAGWTALHSAEKKVAIMWAPNMSRGVQVLAEVVQHAMRRLGSDFDVEIVEVHHRRKVDSPSGTSIRLADAAREVRSELSEVRGRDGIIGARADDEMGSLALRGGDVIGDHTVHLLGDSERLELTHRATNRDLFARGALSAARFISDKPAGRYTIADVLGG